MSEEPPASPPASGVRWAKRRLPFDENDSPLNQARHRGAALLYAIGAVGLAGSALYMALVVRHPPLSAYVMAPAVGAAWFAVRAVMMFGPRS